MLQKPVTDRDIRGIVRRDEPPPRTLSQVLAEMAASQSDISIGEIRDRMGDRGFAAFLIIFAAVNLIPLPPGTSMILGAPLLIVSVQMLLGRDSAWLPNFLLVKIIPRARIAQLDSWITPKLKMIERLIRPRYWPFPRRHTDRWIGAIAMLLAIAVVIPIPLGNWFPAFAIFLLGMALSERDGVLLSIAITVGIVAIGIIGGVVGAAGAIATSLIG